MTVMLPDASPLMAVKVAGAPVYVMSLPEYPPAHACHIGLILGMARSSNQDPLTSMLRLSR